MDGEGRPKLLLLSFGVRGGGKRKRARFGVDAKSQVTATAKVGLQGANVEPGEGRWVSSMRGRSGNLLED